MSDFFRFSFVGLLCALTALRTWYKVKYRSYKIKIFTRDEGVALVLVRWLLGVPLLGATFLYTLSPGSLPWRYLGFPPYLRFIGLATGILSLVLLLQVHRHLDGNFTTSIVVRDEHRLVTTGPYRYVRHPMYLAYFVFFLSVFALTADWVIGVSGLGVITLLMTARLTREERKLLDIYGDEYRAYMDATGRFLPKRKALGRQPSAVRVVRRRVFAAGDER